MTAKFGKLSIGCFIAFSILIFLFVIINSGNDLSSMVTFKIFRFLPWIGILLAFIGTVKKEEPPVYCIIGFILNFLFPFAVVLFALWTSSQFLIPNS